MSWLKIYVFGIVFSWVIFAVFLIRFTCLYNKIRLYLREHHRQFYIDQKLQAVGSLEEFFKSSRVPLHEFHRQTILIFSNKVILDERISSLQRSMKRSLYVTLTFVSTFILLALSGKVIIRWIGL